MTSIRAEIVRAKRELARMQREPCEPMRRVVVVPGYRAREQMGRRLALTLKSTLTRPEWVIAQHHATAHSFEQAGARVLGAVDRAWGREQPLDYVGVSMGGLLGRWLAMPEHGGLPIERLFTMSTPHRGANVAKLATFDASARVMVPGSDGLAELDAALPDARFTMRCYARTRDWWVGTDRHAPDGWRAVVVRTPLPEASHFMASYDVRTIVDIAHHLRGEEAWLVGAQRLSGRA